MLAAVTEVIRAQGGKETETEYFAALVRQFSDHYLESGFQILHQILFFLPFDPMCFSQTPVGHFFGF